MNGPIRVLQVFAGMNMGGAETMIMNLYRHIDRSIIQFDFVVHTNEKCAYDDEIIALGGNIFRVPKYTGKNHFVYKRAWVDFFKKYPDYRIIHGHVRSTASVYLKVANQFNLKTIAHSHSISSGDGIDALVKNLMQRPLKNIANYLFACSLEAGRWLFGETVTNRQNFYIIKNSIDLDMYNFDCRVRSEKRQEFKIQDKIVIGHVGRFNVPKNHIFIIDIFYKTLKKDDKYVLMLVGDGALREQIEEKARTLNILDRVIFTGIRTDVAELLQAMDIFLFPSLYEGLGMALIEAQATGLPCVLSDKIPGDAVITKSNYVIALENPIDVWVNTINEIANQIPEDRRDNVSEIKEAGYDIKSSSEWLTDFYIDLHKKYIKD